MLFLHVLLFFILGTFTVAVPVHIEEVASDSTKIKAGYWCPVETPDEENGKENGKENCSFSRPVCTMDLIYLDRLSITLRYTMTLLQPL